MPISLSAKKSLRKSVKNRKQNLSWKNKFKDLVKKYMDKPAKESLSELFSIIDKLAARNIFHKNKAKRLKAKFGRKLKPTEKTEVIAKKTGKKVVNKAKIAKKKIVKAKKAKKTKK